MKGALEHFAAVNDLDEPTLQSALGKRRPKPSARNDKDSLATALARLDTERTRYEQLYARGIIETIDALTIHLSDIQAKRARILEQLAAADTDTAPRVIIPAARWSEIVTALRGWSEETPVTMPRLDAAKLDYLQAMGVSARVWTDPPPVGLKAHRLRVTVEIAAIGRTGDDAVSAYETDKAVAQAQHIRHGRSKSFASNGKRARPTT